eukprot:TRINITY_DN58037_c0_g1_i1.p1 TRINITY_DN58037_c0_g1~~TRINITY_DN58037_c0_g1_i1.p1  ORF type:complete len:449 (-),score=49.84 TRINITY_DN58037_c0_g1_i1:25-1371(-)
MAAIIIPPTRFGNNDPDYPDWQARGGVIAIGANDGMPVVVQVVDAYPNPLPRRCIWAMLLLAGLWVITVHNNRAVENVGRWRGGGKPDKGKPLPWESQSLVSQNDSYEAIFLTPVFGHIASFVHSPAGKSARGIFSSDILVVPGFFHLPPSCPSGSDDRCFVGVKPLEPSSAISLLRSHQLPDSAACHQFLVGKSPTSLRPLNFNDVTGVQQKATSALCVRSGRIHSVTLSPLDSNATNSHGMTAIVAWDPKPMTLGTCVSIVQLNDMTVGPTMLADSTSMVVYDKGSHSVVTFGFDTSHHLLIVNQFDAATLTFMWRYRLPLSVSWLLRAPRLSDGYLIFVGTEDPFIGTTLVVDLKLSEVYEQEPALSGAKRLPQRRHIQRSTVVDNPRNVSVPKPAMSLSDDGGLCAANFVVDGSSPTPVARRVSGAARAVDSQNSTTARAGAVA